MAFNYPYPVSYQAPAGPYPMYYTPNPAYQHAMAAPQPQQPTMVCAWVQGEAAAKAYPIGPGQNGILMDSEGDLFYIKTVDLSGMPAPLRTFKYEEIVQTQQSNDAPPQQMTEDLVKRSEYEELKRELEELKVKAASMENNQQSKSAQNNRSNNR